MAQIPIMDETFKRLSVLKARSIVSRDGKALTWDDIISASIDVCQLNMEMFEEHIKLKKGKLKPNEVR